MMRPRPQRAAKPCPLVTLALLGALAACDDGAAPLIGPGVDGIAGDRDGPLDAADTPADARPDSDAMTPDMAPDMAYAIDMAPGMASDMAYTIDMTPDMASDMAPPDAAPPDPPDMGPPAPHTAAACFDGLFDGELTGGPDYDRFAPVIGSHCAGTDHQRIERIERVVFVGDSVTVGTPPHRAADFYRNRLAHRLADRFGLTPPDGLWQEVNLIDGTGLVQDSGDFAICARYGARTDDLLQDRNLMADCVPPERRGERTLFVMTMGGNDVSSITQAGLEGATPEELWAETEGFVELMRDAMRWVRAPDRFPNGVSVIFANMFEFTDGTGDITACPAAGLAGFGAEWDDPALLAALVVWANEQYMSIAVEYGVDMIFMLEHFCGHGFNFDDPTAPCYRGPDAELWFDLTCIHPNPTGHQAIADLFEAVVDE